MQEQSDKVQLMYRQPGLPNHQNITDVLDEIILAVRELSERVIILEEYCDELSKLDEEFLHEVNESNYGGTD